MTAAVGALSAPSRAFLDTFATGAALILIAHCVAAYDYALEQVPILTPALQFADAVRAAAVPAGILLMAIFAALRLAEPGRHAILSSRSAPSPCILLFWLGELAFQRLGNLNLLIFFVGVVAATVFAGVSRSPSPLARRSSAIWRSPQTPVMILVGRMDGHGLSSFCLPCRSSLSSSACSLK